eukprot:TRINITY_DN4157_c0_g1_i1.p1 TRINITY_DN4157_c0_g1~~TRINITY_DN4157_c0_g1_i1.p1  ORF type:complete len:199 (-),score=30.51 TRINITY_DN4157_c0_g1_i1:677-1273(-)
MWIYKGNKEIVQFMINSIEMDDFSLRVKYDDKYFEAIHKIVGIKADCKMLHLFFATEGPKSDCPCVACRSPKEHCTNINDPNSLGAINFCCRKNQSFYVNVAKNILNDKFGWALFGERDAPLSDKLNKLFDLLHGASNHGSEVIDLIIRYIDKKKRENFSKMIKEIYPNPNLKLPKVIPSQGECVRLVLASMSSIFSN